MKKPNVILARSFNANRLRGLTRKNFKVPEDKGGILVKNGNATMFSSGKHRLLSVFNPSRWRSGSIRMGCFPISGFSIRIKVEGVLSNDNELMDVVIFSEGKIIDKKLFFQSILTPNKEIRGDFLDIESPECKEIVKRLTKTFSSAELINGLSMEVMISKIRQGVDGVFIKHGIYLDFVSLISVWRSEDRILVAEKGAELDKRLQSIENMGESMNLGSTDNLKKKFYKTDPELEQKIGIHTTGEKHEDEGKAETPPLRRFISSINVKKMASKIMNLPIISNLYNSREKNDDLPDLTKDRIWWWSSAQLIFLYIIGGTTLSWGAAKLMSGASWDNYVEVYVFIWTGVIGVSVRNLRNLYMENERRKKDWKEKGIRIVDDLVGKDRVAVDGLVRNQSRRELLNASEMLNDIRTRLFRQNKIEEAVKIKQIEKKFKKYGKKVMDPNYGHPPYIKQKKLKRITWHSLLDYDEKVLSLAHLLSQRVGTFQQEFALEGFNMEELPKIESELDGFIWSFKNRSRFPKASISTANKLAAVINTKKS